MTTMTHHLKDASDHPSWPVFAAFGAGLSVLLTAIGTFWNLSGNDGGSNDSFGEYAPVLGVIAVATAVVFFVSTRYANPTVGLLLGVLAAASAAVAWSGLPCVLAAGALTMALPRRRETVPMITVALSTLAVVGAIAFAIWG